AFEGELQVRVQPRDRVAQQRLGRLRIALTERGTDIGQHVLPMTPELGGRGVRIGRHGLFGPRSTRIGQVGRGVGRGTVVLAGTSAEQSHVRHYYQPSGGSMNALPRSRVNDSAVRSHSPVAPARPHVGVGRTRSARVERANPNRSTRSNAGRANCFSSGRRSGARPGTSPSRNMTSAS